MRRIRGAILLACLASGVAHAETPQEKADRLFAEGRKELAANNSQRACELFEEAIKLDVTATGTMLNLGLCYENLKKYATSLFWFRKAQAAAAENGLAEYESAAKEHTQANSSKVSIVSITIAGAADAEIRVDGKKIEPTEYGRVEVDAGKHEIVGRTPGKKKVVVEADLAESESKPIVIEFKEDAVPVFVDRGAGRRTGALILAGAGTATLIGVGVYGFIERGKYCANEDCTFGDDNAKTRLRYIGSSVFVVGLGAVVAGAVLYFTAPGKEQISDGTAFAPILAPDEIGVAFSGRF